MKPTSAFADAVDVSSQLSISWVPIVASSAGNCLSKALQVALAESKSLSSLKD